MMLNSSFIFFRAGYKGLGAGGQQGLGTAKAVINGASSGGLSDSMDGPSGGAAQVKWTSPGTFLFNGIRLHKPRGPTCCVCSEPAACFSCKKCGCVIICKNCRSQWLAEMKSVCPKCDEFTALKLRYPQFLYM
jgi:hypothetical protein